VEHTTRGRRGLVLELFKGSGSVGKQARAMGFDVISLDLDPIYTPDIETDILKWDYKNAGIRPDFIWASPPCNTFSPLAYPRKARNTKTAEPLTDNARLGTRILHRTLSIIKYFESKNPNMKYVMENPRGMMRHDAKVKQLPFEATTYYCYYNDGRLKPTNFWSNFDLGLKPIGKKCKNPINVQYAPLMVRYMIPSKLIKHILSQV
jgi:site-specific DNA-cytosine methylase